METMTGPLLRDDEFFDRCISGAAGMDAVKAAAAKGDYPAARRAFAAAVRRNLNPDVYFSIPTETGGDYYRRGESVIEAAEGICRNEIVVCDIPHQFEGTIDWFVNPTFNQYKEWTWQFSRHNEWRHLAGAYRDKGDEKYARCFAYQFESWVRQAVRPADDVPGYQTLCWRTIECGIRMAFTWPEGLYSFYKSPAFTDDLLVDWYKSVQEHGDRLRRQHREFNWLIMEMNGLAQIGLIYPELEESRSWYDYAINKLDEELDRQIYPDGFQYELTTGYHHVVLHNYHRLMKVMGAFGREVPPAFAEKLERAAEVYVKFMQPGGRVPDINDGSSDSSANLLKPHAEDTFPGNEVFKWVISGGKEGRKPPYTSIAMPWSGFLVMRSGWGKDDLWALIDAGPFGRAHQHEDKLSILLFVGGKAALTEGGVYAYDDSEMRRYVLSTRAHNTARVDGMDQNRGKNYRWKDGDISVVSGMKYRIEDDFDFADAKYDEGYGPDCDRSVTHRRSVVFFKKVPAPLSPFFVVIDRFYTEKNREHVYDLLWHFDEKTAGLGLRSVSTPALTLFHSAVEGECTLVMGQERPEWQGWLADSAIQGDYRPAPVLVHTCRAGSLRVLTLLYPCAKNVCPVSAVEAGSGIDDTDIRIRHSGGELVLKEDNYRLEPG